ncbi:uncharacterized protein LOC116295590 [Actinia tenebrosa]|uniref:Uncharacterized protein LOC116295590 n=1 Tax=Actinia tenebrosa TaxID=6105 RepID=A0A6P8HVE0_ACTTE|nr:uncharacterized protein LOC116295590 [Actinia tenebrosa]
MCYVHIQAKPVVASAKHTVWTVRKKDLMFQKGTKITIIDRYGTNKYLCQNDKAELGYVNEENISFKIAPVELTLNKPKISSPFGMRHTNCVAILKKHKETGVFPVEVENLVALAAKDSQANISVEPKPCSSQGNVHVEMLLNTQ